MLCQIWHCDRLHVDSSSILRRAISFLWDCRVISLVHISFHPFFELHVQLLDYKPLVSISASWFIAPFYLDSEVCQCRFPSSFRLHFAHHSSDYWWFDWCHFWISCVNNQAYSSFESYFPLYYLSPECSFGNECQNVCCLRQAPPESHSLWSSMDRQSSSRSPKFSCMSQLEFSHSSEFSCRGFSSFLAQSLVDEAGGLPPYL